MKVKAILNEMSWSLLLVLNVIEFTSDIFDIYTKAKPTLKIAAKVT